MPRLAAEHPFFLCDASFSGGAPRRMCVGACSSDAVGGGVTESVTARAAGADIPWRGLVAGGGGS